MLEPAVSDNSRDRVRAFSVLIKSKPGFGSLADALSAYGTITFSGTGTYTTNLTLVDLAAQQLQTGTTSGTYSVAASGHDEDALPFRLLHDLQTVRDLKLPRPTRRKTTGNGIVLQEILLAVLVQTLCPRLKRRDLLRIVEIRKKPLVVHFDFGCILNQARVTGIGPITDLTWNIAQTRVTVRPFRSRGAGSAGYPRSG